MSSPSRDLRLRRLTTEQATSASLAFADLEYPQVPGYALEAAYAVGARCEFVAIEAPASAGAPLGFAALRMKTIPLIGGGLAYLHGGPACRPTGQTFDLDRWRSILRAVATSCAGRGLTLRVAGTHGQDPLGEADYAGLGFVPARQVAGRTIVMDLAPPPDELRARLAGKWRTDLRRGEAAGLRIERSAEPEAIARLQPMLASMAAHKGFAVPQDALFFARAAALSSRSAPPPFVAHLAYLGDRLVAGHIGSYTGDTAVYLLGASDDRGRETRAAYLLQWAVIAYARERGVARYDLGGIDRKANPQVYRFKARMGGLEVERPSWWERPAGIIRPRLIAAAERLRERVRGTR